MRHETLNAFFSKLRFSRNYVFQTCVVRNSSQFSSDLLEILTVASQIDCLWKYLGLLRLIKNYIFYKQFKIRFFAKKTKKKFKLLPICEVSKKKLKT